MKRFESSRKFSTACCPKIAEVYSEVPRRGRCINPKVDPKGRDFEETLWLFVHERPRRAVRGYANGSQETFYKHRAIHFSKKWTTDLRPRAVRDGTAVEGRQRMHKPESNGIRMRFGISQPLPVGRCGRIPSPDGRPDGRSDGLLGMTSGPGIRLSHAFQEVTISRGEHTAVWVG